MRCRHLQHPYVGMYRAHKGGHTPMLVCVTIIVCQGYETEAPGTLTTLVILSQACSPVLTWPLFAAIAPRTGSAAVIGTYR